MEFHEKLQTLRKQKGLTQEQLAALLFVSRAAISKWESGRGYPNIDSLKAIAAYFGLTVDELLSEDTLPAIKEPPSGQSEHSHRDLVLGVMDCSTLLLCFLPFFGQKAVGGVRSVSLLSLTGISCYVKTAYGVLIAGMVLTGILTLALQNCRKFLWTSSKYNLSLAVTIFGILLFIVTQQPYPAVLLLAFTAVKLLILAKRQ